MTTITHHELDHIKSTPRSVSTRRRRLGPWAGAAFVVFFAASFLVGPAVDIHDSKSKTLADYAHDATKLKALVAWSLAVLAVLALVWFLADLVTCVRAGGGESDRTVAVALAGGLLAATVTIASAIRAAPIGDLVMDNEQRAGSSGKLTPAFAAFAHTTGSLYDWLVFFGVGMAAATLVVSVSLATRSTGVLPRWLRWTGYAIAPVLAFAAFFNIIVLLLWIAAVSIALARAPELAEIEPAA